MTAFDALRKIAEAAAQKRWPILKATPGALTNSRRDMHGEYVDGYLALADRLASDDAVERAALVLHTESCADDECDGSDLGSYESDARAALVAALTGGEDDA